jgi:hypothetical protein
MTSKIEGKCMNNFICMLILICGLLFAACGKKDESSTPATKTASPPATPAASRDSKGMSPSLDAIPTAKWNLSVYDANEATLVSSHQSPEQEVVRVDIKKAGTQTGWHIQLNQAPLKVESNHRYRLSFRARADGNRNVLLGFARAHAPWTDLGLYRSLVLNPEWHSFQEEFVATADDDNARILFDLGGNGTSAEFAGIKLERVADVK